MENQNSFEKMGSKDQNHRKYLFVTNFKNCQIERDAPAKSNAIFNNHYKKLPENWTGYFLHNCKLSSIFLQDQT